MPIKNPIYSEIKTELSNSEKHLFEIFLEQYKYDTKNDVMRFFNLNKSRIRSDIVNNINNIFKEFERFPEEKEIFNYSSSKYLKLRKEYVSYVLYKKFYNISKKDLLDGKLDLKKRKVLIERLKELGFDKNKAIDIVKNIKSLEELENKLNLKLF